MIKMFKIEFAGFFAKTLGLVVHVNMILNQCLNEIRTILEGPWPLDSILEEKMHAIENRVFFHALAKQKI